MGFILAVPNKLHFARTLFYYNICNIEQRRFFSNGVWMTISKIIGNREKTQL